MTSNGHVYAGLTHPNDGLLQLARISNGEVVRVNIYQNASFVLGKEEGMKENKSSLI